MVLQIDKLLVGFALFTMVILVGVLLIEDTNTNYDLNLSTDDFNATFDLSSEMYNISRDMNDNVLGNNIEEENPFDSMLSGSFTAMRLIRRTFSMSGLIMEQVATKLGIPKFFVTLALAIFTILIIFSIIFIISGIARPT